jgi:hypothetical protein
MIGYDDYDVEGDDDDDGDDGVEQSVEWMEGEPKYSEETCPIATSSTSRRLNERDLF